MSTTSYAHELVALCFPLLYTLTAHAVSLIPTSPAAQDTNVAQGGARHLPADVAQRDACLARAFAALWPENSGSERDKQDSVNDTRVADVADDVLINSIVAILRDHWMIAKGEVSRPSGPALWGEEEDNALIEYVMGPLRPQLLCEEEVRTITCQVRVALAIHRAFTMIC